MTKSKKLLFVLCSMLTFFFVQSHPALAKKVRYNYFCTHGIIAQPESYEGLQLTKLAGEGKEFRWYVDIDNYNRRFFIPLTSPVMTESTHVYPALVYLLFKTICNAAVDQISIYDGDQRIFQTKVVPQLSGDYSYQQKSNSFSMTKSVEVTSGLNMVIDVVTTGESDCEDDYGPGILFIGAGADYWRTW